MKRGISIIVPVYNEESTIARAIKEITDFGNAEKLKFEIIIVDSASTDNTEKICL